MIRINLLPTEKRKQERTPLPRLALIMTTAAAATVLILWVLWILLKIKTTGDEIRDMNTELASLQTRLAEYELLTTQKAQRETKLTEIRELVKRPMEDGWWRAVNALWDVINNHPRVWIDDLRVLDERTIQSEVKRADTDDKTAPPYGITMRCHVAGDDVAEMTKFRNALKAHPVLQETLTNINKNLDWKIDREQDFNADSISFSVGMWGPMSKPKKKGAPPPGKAGPTAGAPAAPAGGVR